MNALSDYQKNILSHMGIAQWQLREADSNSTQGASEDVAALSEPHAFVPAVKSGSAEQLAALKQTLTPKDEPEAAKPAEVAKSSNPAVRPESAIMPEPAAQSEPVSSDVKIVTINDVSQPLVNDVLLALGLTKDAIQNKQIVWQIGDSIALSGQVLVTPPIEQLGDSAELKQQLWKTLQQWQN